MKNVSMCHELMQRREKYYWSVSGNLSCPVLFSVFGIWWSLVVRVLISTNSPHLFLQCRLKHTKDPLRVRLVQHLIKNSNWIEIKNSLSVISDLKLYVFSLYTAVRYCFSLHPVTNQASAVILQSEPDGSHPHFIVYLSFLVQYTIQLSASGFDQASVSGDLFCL